MKMYQLDKRLSYKYTFPIMNMGAVNIIEKRICKFSHLIFLYYDIGDMCKILRQALEYYFILIKLNIKGLLIIKMNLGLYS